MRPAVGSRVPRAHETPKVGDNLVPMALFPGFGGGAGKATSKTREKRPEDGVGLETEPQYDSDYKKVSVLAPEYLLVSCISLVYAICILAILTMLSLMLIYFFFPFFIHLFP